MTRLARFLAGPALSLTLVLGSATTVAAQTNRLNGPLPRALRTGYCSQHLVTPDGERIVYRADKLLAFTSFELFSAPLDASAPSIRLNERLRPGGRVSIDIEDKAFLLASGNRVVYLLDRRGDGVDEVHVVPADGSAGSTRVTPQGFDVAGFWLTPADELLFHGSGLDLFRVPLAGGTPQGLAFNRFVDRVWVAPGGATTVFSTRRDDFSQWLFRVPTDGSAQPVQLDVSSIQSPGASSFDAVRFAPDGIHVLYEERAEHPEGEPDKDRYALRSATLDGSHAAVTLSQTENLFRGGYAFDPSPGAARVAFREGSSILSSAFDGTALATLATHGFSEDQIPIQVHGTHALFGDASGTDHTLFRVPLDGSQPAAPLFPPGPVTLRSFAPVDAARVALITQDATGFRALYTVPLAGGSPLLLNPPAAPDRGAWDFVVEPGGQHITFSDSPVPLAGSELYRVPSGGGAAPVLVNVGLLGEYPRDYSIAPGARVVFHAFQPLGGSGVFGAPLDGLGPVVQYNEPILADTVVGDVTGFVATADGATVVYRADEEADEAFALFRAHPSGLGNPVRLTGLLPATHALQHELALTPAGDRVVFQTSTGGGFTLWSAPTGAEGTPVELDASAFELEAPFLTTHDGARVVYRRKVNATDVELRSAALDGATGAVTLHPSLPAGSTVREFELEPGGARVVYRASPAAQGRFELFSAPFDGSAPPRRLHAPLQPGRTVDSFRVAATGRRVVFRADLAADNLVELWSAPIAGGPAPRRLSGPLVAGGDVTHFALSPGGRTVVYRADQVSDQRFDLFAAPIEGRLRRIGAPHGGATLLTALTATRRVETDFAFTPDGAEIVYRANALAQADVELFRVPVDGSAAPVRLSEPPVPGGEVRSFAIAPDGSRVVYRAHQGVDDTVELFSVPLAGGAAVPLDPLLATLDPAEYRIDPESRRVLFRARTVGNNLRELFASPLDGSVAPVRLNRPLALQGEVQPDFVVLPGGRALYRAQQLQRDVLELFVALDLADAILPAARAGVR